jgi:membrane protein DedA with SNARE-associated domain
MNSDQIGGIIRAVVPALFGWLAGKGIITPDQAGALTQAVIPAVVTIAAVLWSVHSNKSGKLIGK